MIENFITELDKPLKAIKMLLILMEEYIEDDLSVNLENTEKDRNANILAITYTMGLVKDYHIRHVGFNT